MAGSSLESWVDEKQQLISETKRDTRSGGLGRTWAHPLEEEGSKRLNVRSVQVVTPASPGCFTYMHAYIIYTKLKWPPLTHQEASQPTAEKWVEGEAPA